MSLREQAIDGMVGYITEARRDEVERAFDALLDFLRTECLEWSKLVGYPADDAGFVHLIAALRGIDT